MDDILIACTSAAQARHHTLSVALLLSSLGLKINWEKSVLTPTRRIRHLGFLIDTTTRSFVIPADKLSDLTAFCRTAALRPRLRLTTVRSLLGKLLSLRLAFAPMRRYTWSLIFELNANIPPTRSLRNSARNTRVILSPSARRDLLWLATNLPRRPSCPYAARATVTIYTDASLFGWGAWSPQLNLTVHSRWLPTGPLPHIQVLELLAVIHAIRSLPIPRHSRIALFTDNTSVIAYLRRWGGSAQPTLHALSHQLWDSLEARQLHLHSVKYIPSADNTLADQLSRPSTT
jgi:hypothetical protein